MENIEYRGNRDKLPEGFAMIIPKGPFVPYKPPPISIWKKVVCFLIGHKWGSAGVSWVGPGFPRKCKRCKKEKWFDRPNFRMRLAQWIDKTLDKIWKPLCTIGLHRWKSHYGYRSFSFGGDNPAPEVRQHIYKCSCCKETKTVTL